MREDFVKIMLMESMTVKDKYNQFIQKVYVPIYSQPWWLDAICSPGGWNVWLYESGNEVWAAMPYYYEDRGKYRYITKAPLTQNNGIIFRYPQGISAIGKCSHEEKIIDAANLFVESLKLDVYEQQYHYSFTNYLPFFWNHYNAIPRYTYVIRNDISLEDAWQRVSSKQRSIIKKGRRNGQYSESITKEQFFEEHKKIFEKQGLNCPFSYDLWNRLYENVKERNQGKIACYKNEDNRIISLIFWVWDDRSVYQLLGGGVPQYQNLDTYDSLIWDGVIMAKKMGKSYDFEGSMIKRISKSFREYGGEPKQYFRIRKVYNEDIARKECEDYCKSLQGERR